MCVQSVVCVLFTCCNRNNKGLTKKVNKMFSDARIKFVLVLHLYMCICMCGWYSPYPISLIKCRDHGCRVFRHKSNQQLEHIVDILILKRKESMAEQVNKGVKGSPAVQTNRGL